MALNRYGPQMAWPSTGMALNRRGPQPAWPSTGLALNRGGPQPAWPSTGGGPQPAWPSTSNLLTTDGVTFPRYVLNLVAVLREKHLVLERLP